MLKENIYKIEEWKSLREEIARKQSLNYKIIFSTIGLNFAIYSFALVKQTPTALNAIFVMLPVFLVGLSHFWVLRNDYSAYRIALFIKNCIEDPGHNEFKWESVLQELNRRIFEKKKETHGVGNKNIRETHFLFYSFYILSPVLSTILLFQTDYTVSDSHANISLLFNISCPMIISFMALYVFDNTLIKWLKEDIHLLTNVILPCNLNENTHKKQCSEGE